MSYILLTNDDGIDAPGLLTLARSIGQIADRVEIIAPAVNQSNSGHKITLFQEIQVEHRTVDDTYKGVAVHGSPADCIALAALGMVDWPPRMVISGINRGANMGQDISYSGTVSAALEATIQGIPAIAVSLDNHLADDPAEYIHAAELAAEVAQKVMQQGLPPFTMLNLNVPVGDAVQGIRLTRQGVRIYRNELEKGDGFVRVVGAPPTGVLDALGTDLWAVHNGYASLTPLHLDFTAHHFIADLAAWDLNGHS